MVELPNQFLLPYPTNNLAGLDFSAKGGFWFQEEAVGRFFIRQAFAVERENVVDLPAVAQAEDISGRPAGAAADGHIGQDAISHSIERLAGSQTEADGFGLGKVECLAAKAEERLNWTGFDEGISSFVKEVETNQNEVDEEEEKQTQIQPAVSHTSIMADSSFPCQGKIELGTRSLELSI